ncbi:MAG: hypothetical protein ACJ79H_21670 [Myxococcales bacterium]
MGSPLMPVSREREGVASRVRRLADAASYDATAVARDDLVALLAVADEAAELVHALDEYGGSEAIGPYVERLDSALTAVADTLEGTGGAEEASDAAPGLLSRPNGTNEP